jgi:hypothetical protein
MNNQRRGRGWNAVQGWILAAITVWGVSQARVRAADAPADAWALAQQNAAVHRFSTLFTAQDVRRYLASEDGLQAAIDWCKRTAVTKVYVETFRDGYQADRAVLTEAIRRFRSAGFAVSGCVTPTRVGKSSTGWKDTISCYTDPPTQEKVQAIFEYVAALFDEVMIDDFWFTDCACPECDAARQAKRVVIGRQTYPVAGDSWEDYRCELMVRLSRDRVMAPARKVNPQVRLIIKYPQWYDRFHERGYEVARETADFDRIWVGTETRDYGDARWGGTVQYEAYFIMRWLGGIGGEKCGGGWYDWLGTTEATYIEQARQTILGGARESFLFCYGGLQRDTGPANIQALRWHQPELFAAAREIRGRRPAGVAAYKPINSHPENESRIFDFVGMLGIPLVPCHEFPTGAAAAFFSLHALKDPDFANQFSALVKAGKPVLITDGLAKRLGAAIAGRDNQIQVLPVNGDPKSLLTLAPAELDRIRAPLLKSFATELKAPNKIGLYLFTDGSHVVENFNDQEVEVLLNQAALKIPARGWRLLWK